jgi:hypothetical protein
LGPPNGSEGLDQTTIRTDSADWRVQQAIDGALSKPKGKKFSMSAVVGDG